MKCEYKDTLQVCRGDGVAVYAVKVFYKDDNGEELLHLCKACMQYVTEDALMFGHTFGVIKL